MITQGFPLWATVEGEPETPYLVIGWKVRETISLPYLVPLGDGVHGAWCPDDSYVFWYTTTDPTTATVEQSETEIREQLRGIAERLDALGATGPARGIRDVLDAPDRLRRSGIPAGMTIFGYAMEEVAERLQRTEESDDLRQRMAALADYLESGGFTFPARDIRAELAK